MPSALRAGGGPRAAIPADRALAAQSHVVPLRLVGSALAGPSSALAGSSSRPGDSRMTRTRGGGEPEGDGVSRAALHSSVPDRRLLSSPALSSTRVREAQGSASVLPLSPSRTLSRHGYMGTEEGRSTEAASRPLSTHDVTTDSVPARHSSVPDRRLLSSPALSSTRVRKAQGSADSAPAADCVMTNDEPPQSSRLARMFRATSPWRNSRSHHSRWLA